MTSEKSIRIREGAVANAEALSEINVQGWKDAFRGIVPDERLDAMQPEQRVDGFRDTLASATVRRQRFIVAEIDNAVVGFAGFGPTRDDDEDPAQVGEIGGLYVHPKHWRQGIGRQLMNAAVGALEARGFTEATLWTLAESRQSRGFYEAMDWQADGTTTSWNESDIQLVRYRRRIAGTPDDGES